MRPTIVLSAKTHGGASAEEIDGILLHELTHVARRDLHWQVISKCVHVMYWFHPLVWISDRLGRDVRETVCDRFCVGMLGSRNQYADCLLSVAQTLSRPVPLTVGLGIVRRPRIVGRLRDVATGEPLGRCGWPVGVRALLLVLAIIGTSLVGVGWESDGYKSSLRTERRAVWIGSVMHCQPMPSLG
jgi:beta-lactamase regulating signal transducer with metallopeptidase domain